MCRRVARSVAVALVLLGGSYSIIIIGVMYGGSGSEGGKVAGRRRY